MKLSSSTEAETSRVHKWTELVYSPRHHPEMRVAESALTHWDNRDILLSDLPRPKWPDSNNEEARPENPAECKPLEVSEHMYKLLSSAFATVLTNTD